MLKVSIGIPIYNEAENIASLFESILIQEGFDFQEIIFVLSGCSDSSEEKIRQCILKEKRCRLLKQDKREGKASAVNIFLKEASGDILILISSDVVLDKYCLSRILTPLQDKRVGMVGGRPIPIKNTSNNLVYIANKIIWDLHHHLALIKPKLGEVIAFKNIIDKIPCDTAVDEVLLEALIINTGSILCYKSDALIYNKCPTRIRDLFSQRVRIYWGHIDALVKTGYKASSMEYKLIFWIILEYAFKRSYLLFYIIFLCILETAVRVMAYYKFYFIRGKLPFIWQKYRK